MCVCMCVFVGQEERAGTENRKAFSSGANQEAQTPPLLAQLFSRINLVNSMNAVHIDKLLWATSVAEMLSSEKGAQLFLQSHPLVTSPFFEPDQLQLHPKCLSPSQNFSEIPAMLFVMNWIQRGRWRHTCCIYSYESDLSKTISDGCIILLYHDFFIQAFRNEGDRDMRHTENKKIILLDLIWRVKSKGQLYKLVQIRPAPSGDLHQEGI